MISKRRKTCFPAFIIEKYLLKTEVIDIDLVFFDFSV